MHDSKSCASEREGSSPSLAICKPRFGSLVNCKGGKIAEERCGHYTDGICDMAEWDERWEKYPCPNAEWPQKPFNRYTALIYVHSD